MTRKLGRQWWRYPLLVMALTVVIFFLWTSIVSAPMKEAIAALQPDEGVAVATSPWLVFRPTGSEPDTGLILYPGAQIEHRAYAPAARAMAEQGYLVVIVPMPLHLAVFGAERAKGVIDAFPTIQHWAVGGHSLGGAMAAQFAHRHQDLVEGLVLWAAYPPNANDLSGSALKVLSISGTQDRFTTAANIEASRVRLPVDTRYVVIQGGNHSQFGWYGTQYGDGEPTILRQSQQEQIVAATLELLGELR